MADGEPRPMPVEEEPLCVCCLASNTLNLFCVNPMYEEEGKLSEMDDHDDEEGRKMRMGGQLTFTLVAAVALTFTSLRMFRYRQFGTYYAAGDVTGTNWWLIGNMISQYSALSLWGLAFLTQLLALFGVLNKVNFFVWEIGIFRALPLLSLVGAIFSYIAYEKAYGLVDGMALMGAIRLEYLQTLIEGSMTGMALQGSAKSWTQANLRKRRMENERRESDGEDDVLGEDDEMAGEPEVPAEEDDLFDF